MMPTRAVAEPVFDRHDQLQRIPTILDKSFTRMHQTSGYLHSDAPTVGCTQACRYNCVARERWEVGKLSD
jgi:hypothetical protein